MTSPATTPADGLEQERAEFEAKFPMPRDCIWTGRGYAATSYNAWDAQKHASRWDGWKAARATPSPAQATPADAMWTLIERYADAVSLYNEAVRIDVGIDKAGKECLEIERQLRAALATPSPGKAPERRKLDDDLLATIREAAKTRAEGAITQDGRAVFINYGDSEQQMLDAAEMDCPHCGGSGHKDDASPGKAEAE